MNRLTTKLDTPLEPVDVSAAEESDVGAGNHQLKLILAFAAIYIIWGTTYLAMSIAVKTIPPFTIAGWRFLLAGIVLILVLAWRRVPLPTSVQWKSSIFIGCLLMIGGNGLVMYAIQKIPSGICAVVIATMPLWMTLLDWRFYKGPKPGWKVWLGLILGLAGIVLLFAQGEAEAEQTTWHFPSFLAIVCAPIFWSIGSLHSRTIDMPKNVFMSTAAQMLCGGLALIGLSIAMGEPATIDWPAISWQSLVAVGYLTFVGSLVALTSYMWLLKNANAARVSTYTYVNPVIAVFLGWLILSEPITSQTMVAVLLIVGAVVMIVSLKDRRQPKTAK